MSKRKLLASTLERSGLGSLLFRTAADWRGLLVFNYHRVGDSSQSSFDRALWSATQVEFERQVRFLKRDFDVLRVDELDDVLSGKARRGVLITFDDGYRDNYELAWPVLTAHGVPATFFLTSGFLDDRPVSWWDEIAWMVHVSQKAELPPLFGIETPLSLSTSEAREHTIVTLLRTYKRMPSTQTAEFLEQLSQLTGSGRCPQQVADSIWMTWDMVREMDQSGMDIGGHTVTHPILANTDPVEQETEIFESKRRIEQELGHAITAFSYPVGQPDSFNETTKQLLQSAGYQHAFSFYGGYCKSHPSDKYDLPRVSVSPYVDESLFQSMAHMPWLFA